MKFSIFLCSIIGSIAFTADAAKNASTAGSDKSFTHAELKNRSEYLQWVDPTSPSLIFELERRFGKKETYDQIEVDAVFNPATIKTKSDYETKEARRTGPPPPGAISATALFQSWETESRIDPSNKGKKKALIRKFGEHDWYLAAEARDVDTSGDTDLEVEEPALPSPEIRAKEQAYQESLTWWDRGKAAIRIRKDWSDLLYAEDFSQPGNAEKTIDDLVGATFSYRYDGKADSDSWAVNGAVVVPWLWRTDQGVKADFIPEQFMVVPSVTFNRFTTNGDPANEVDEIFYRLGGYFEWVGPTGKLDFLQIRGAGVYATDSDHEAELPGFEVDIEPRIFWEPGSFANKYLKIGASNVLVPKMPQLPDTSDQSLLDYQLRIWLHAEGGEIQHSADGWKPAGDSFFRVGPMAQLRVNMPTIMRGASLTAEYAYLPQDRSQDSHESYFKAAASLTLHEDKNLGHKVSLVAEYTEGGLSFTDEEVEAFTLGLGVRF
jgi:hypothetical protein